MENEKKLKFNPDDMIAAADEQFLEWMKNGRYAELIDTMPNLGRYSLRNQMLILIQNPKATCVNGMNAWNYKRRHIEKGQTSIRIIAPKFASQVSTDKDGNITGLTPIQKTVGGNIDVVYLPDIDDVHGFCNDEGLFIGMEPNFYRPAWKDAIVGPAIFFGSGYDGGSESLSREQVKKITNFLTANSVIDYGEFYMNVKTDFAYYKPKSVPEM